MVACASCGVDVSKRVIRCVRCSTTVSELREALGALTAAVLQTPATANLVGIPLKRAVDLLNRKDS